MNSSIIKIGLIGFLLGAIGMWFLTTTVLRSNLLGKANVNNLSQNSDILDAHFIEQMIPHHEDAITMSSLALTKATRPEVKQLAQNIIDSQGKEINQMKVWYQDWFGKELPTGDDVMSEHGMVSNKGMHMGMMGNDTDITRLEKAEDFDTAFVEHMIPHHQMAVMMASMLKNGTGRAEMKKLAEDIITSQTNEINQMRQWLIDWEN